MGQQPDAGPWGGPGASARSGPRAPVLPLGRRMRQVGWVLTVIGVLVLGGVVADQLLASAAEPPVRVSAEVTVQPRSGWRTASRSGGTVLLTRGSGNLRVVATEAVPRAGERAAERAAEAIAREYVERELEPRARGGVRLAPADPVELVSGLLAEGVTYQGEFGVGERSALVEGEVRAVAEPGGTVVVFDSWAQPEVYPYTADEVEDMTQTAEVR